MTSEAKDDINNAKGFSLRKTTTKKLLLSIEMRVIEIRTGLEKEGKVGAMFWIS